MNYEGQDGTIGEEVLNCLLRSMVKVEAHCRALKFLMETTEESIFFYMYGRKLPLGKFLWTSVDPVTLGYRDQIGTYNITLLIMIFINA